MATLRSPEEIRAEMAALVANLFHDPEALHTELDRLMVSTLRALGYGDAMDVFEAAHVWYA